MIQDHKEERVGKTVFLVGPPDTVVLDPEAAQDIKPCAVAIAEEKSRSRVSGLLAAWTGVLATAQTWEHRERVVREAMDTRPWNISRRQWRKKHKSK